MELWNDRFLTHPPNNAVKTRIPREDLLRLRNMFKDALNILESKKFLDREASVLSRQLFRHKRRYRHHSLSRFLDKVYRGVKRYFLMDVKEIFYNFEKSLGYALDDADISNSVEVFLPTRQLLEYVLIRIQGFAKLMQYLANASQNAAKHCLEYLRMQHLLRDYTLAFCIVSRIWYFSSYFVSCACSWYKELLAFRHVLKPVGADWLPHNYKFPVELSVWLGRNALTGKFWSSDIDVEVGSANLTVVQPSSVDLGEVISRTEYNSSILKTVKTTDTFISSYLGLPGAKNCNESTLDSSNKYFEQRYQISKQEEREKHDEIDQKGPRKEKKRKIKLSEEPEISTEDVISREESDASFFLQNTDKLISSSLSLLGATSYNKSSLESSNKHFEAKPETFMKLKRQKQKGKGKKNKEIKLQEEAKISTEVPLSTTSQLNAVTSKSKTSVAKEKELKEKEEIMKRKSNQSTSNKVSMVVGHRFKKKRRVLLKVK